MGQAQCGALTHKQAIAELANPANAAKYQSFTGLSALASQVTVDIPGTAEDAVTLLYSGPMSNGPKPLHAWKVAEAVGASSDHQVRTIGQTEVAKFLNSRAFQRAARTAAGGDRAAYDDFIDNPQTGLWAMASQRFVDAARGDVKTLTPFAKTDRVFAQVELQRALANEHVTTIDAMPRAALVGLRDDVLAKGGTDAQAMEQVTSAVRAASFSAAAALEIAEDANNGLLVGTRAFFAGTWAVHGRPLPAGTLQRTPLGSVMASLAQTEKASLRDGQNAMQRAAEVSALHGQPQAQAALLRLATNVHRRLADIDLVPGMERPAIRPGIRGDAATVCRDRTKNYRRMRL